MTRLLLPLLLLLAACQSDDQRSEAHVFADDAVSLVPPKGWEVRRDRDTLVFLAGSPTDRSRATISIRAVPIDSWSEPRTLDSVLPDTEAVLRALPGAEVAGPTDVDHPVYRARAFDVTWTPRSQRGRRYQRRHVTIEATQHIFHVFLTSADGQLDDGDRELQRVIASLREEV